MKVTLDMENLAGIVQEIVSKNINNVIEEKITSMIAHHTEQKADEIIQQIVNEKLTSYVENYIKTATISVGGGWNSEPKVYTVDQYIQMEIADSMNSHTLKTKDRNGYSTTVTFEEFIKQECDIESKVQAALKKFMNGVKADVNRNVSAIFDQATQAALSESIVNLLMNSNTFLDMKESIQRITDGK